MNKELTKEEIEKNRELMKYAIHTNVLEGYVFTEENINFLMSVAEGKMTIEEAIKIVLEK